MFLIAKPYQGKTTKIIPKTITAKIIFAMGRHIACIRNDSRQPPEGVSEVPEV